MPEAARKYNASVENPLANEMIKTLLYFDIFHYPLTKEEILFFSPSLCTADQVDMALLELLEKGLIHKFERFYSLQDDHSLIDRRIAGNKLATDKLKTANKISKLISWFPFVRSVMLSGSISKGYMDEKSDIDFFIVTAPGRLWITRTLLVLFKRIFLFNSHRIFCVNYFIDTENLEIEEKNLFTAIESITLVPTYGEKCYYEFWTNNEWVQQFFPNASPRDTATMQNGNTLMKTMAEKMFSNRIGNAIDQYFMQLTLKRWQTLFSKHYSQKDFEVAFKTKKYASKNHPRFYQKSILDKYQDKISSFENNFNISLTSVAV